MKHLFLLLFIVICNFFSIIAQDKWVWERISLPTEINTLRIYNAKQINNGNVLLTCFKNQGRYGAQLSNGLWVLNSSMDSILYSFPEMPVINRIVYHKNDVYAMRTIYLNNNDDNLYKIKNIIKSSDNGRTWNNHRFNFRVDTFKKGTNWTPIYDTLSVATNLLSINDSILVASCWHRSIVDIDNLWRIERSNIPKLYIFKSYDDGKTWSKILNKELQCSNPTYCSGYSLLYDKSTQMVYFDKGEYLKDEHEFYRFSLDDTVVQTIKSPKYTRLNFDNEYYLACSTSGERLCFLQDTVYIQRPNPIDTLIRNCLMYGTLPVFDTDGKIFIRYPYFSEDIYYDKSHFFVSADTGMAWKNVGTPFDSTLHYFTVLKNGTYLLQTYSLDTYSSDDKGKTWRKLQWNIDRSGINAITFDKERRIYVGTNAAHGVVRSSQTTFDWEILGGTHKTQSHVLVQNDGTIYRTQRDAYDDCEYNSDDLYNFHRMYRQLPGSTVWDTLYIDYNNGLKGISLPRDVKLTSNEELLVVGRYCVQRSTDKGNTWTYFEKCDEGSSSTIIELENGAMLLGGTFYPRLWNNGKWNTIKDVSSQGAGNSIGYTGMVYSKKSNRIYMRPDNGGRSEFDRQSRYYECPLYFSDDNAITWDSVELYNDNRPLPGNLLILDSLDNVYMYSDTEIILRSTDKGKTWENITSNLLDIIPSPEINTMAASPEGWIYVGTATHGLWRSRLRFPPVGVQEEEQTTHTIRISPNPANTIIHLAGTHNAPALIADMQGRTVFYGTDTMIDISTWHTGMYCLIIPSTGQKVLFAVMR